MKKVSNTCLGAVLLSNLFMMRLQKASIDCISFTGVSFGFSSQLLLAVSLLTSVLRVSSVFMSILSGGCFSAPSTRVVFLVLLLVVTALTTFIRMGFVLLGSLGVFWGVPLVVIGSLQPYYSLQKSIQILCYRRRVLVPIC